MIRITSNRDGFRRCGVVFGKQPADFPNGRFNKEELAILEAEPMLSVEIVKEQGKPKPAA